ncbi:ECF sigma factor [Jatrophihabitans endophyticus]|uniref:ECF sigma factor n=2 Tax=Jatrophihabitans endophyticus TaxID=1206085 RepID=A0A1M5T076_9ACTN|nr:ECF sigma factor [Jatrophihabitans endophyticus]
MSQDLAALMTTFMDDDDPQAALRCAADLRRVMERREAVVVRRARVSGLAWAEIAACLGVSKQAVHRKYAGSRLAGGHS